MQNNYVIYDLLNLIPVTMTSTLKDDDRLKYKFFEHKNIQVG